MAAFSGGSGVLRPGRSPSSCWRDAVVQVGATVTTEFGAGWVDTPASGTRARRRTAFHAEALALWYVGPTVQALHATPNLPCTKPAPRRGYLLEKAFAPVLLTAAKNLFSPAKARWVTGAVAVRHPSEL